MKEKKLIDDKDIAVLELLDDPVWFGEFIRSAVEDKLENRSWDFDNYQKRMLLDNSHYISAATARSTGKTVCMETRIVYDAVSNKYAKASENEILFVVQSKNLLEPVFLRLTKFFRRHPLLKYFINKNSINFSQHEIKLLNGALIRCRLIGSTADSNVIGLHVPCIFLDEGQVFSYSAWNSLQQCLTGWDEGFKLWVSGVHNGLREKNVLFEVDQMDEKFSKHNVSRLESPRYTKEQHAVDLKQYGGVEGDDYVHLCLGLPGSPAFSVFDRKLMKIENYPVAISLLNNMTLESAGGKFNEVLSAPDAPQHDLIIAACDMGFSSEPTIITILYQLNNIWKEFARFELRRIKYPVQSRIIDWLDRIYGFNMIAMDQGSSGLAIAQFIQENQLDMFKRLVMVDFQGGVITGYNEDGSEIKDRVRKFTIQQLQKWLQNDQILILSNQDDDLVSELERVGFTRDMLGVPKYFVYSPQGGQKGDDHILASLLTWVYGFYYNYFSPQKPEKRGKYSDLATGGWLVGNRIIGVKKR